MNMDVSKLSRTELLELRKSINDALDGGNYITYKSETGTINSLHDIFEARFDRENITPRFCSDILTGMEKAIYKLCDVTLCNYKLKVKEYDEYDSASNGFNKREGHTIVAMPVLPIDETRQLYYQDMCEKILDIIEEYSKKEDKK